MLRMPHPRSNRPASWRQWVAPKVATFCLALVSLLSAHSLAENAAASEHEIKAAMLYKFLGYIEWPEQAFPSDETPYRIGVLRSSKIAEQLKDISQDRTVNGRPIEIVELDNLRDLEEVHMLFVGRRASRYMDRISRQVEGAPVVVVTENQEGPQRGSTINLRLIQDRVAFDVSLAATDCCELKMSSRLLAIAASVQQEPH